MHADIFTSDPVLDFEGEFLKAPSLSRLMRAFEAITKGGAHDIRACANALAAASVLAALAGKPHHLSHDISEWAATQTDPVPEALSVNARAALHDIKASPVFAEQSEWEVHRMRLLAFLE